MQGMRCSDIASVALRSTPIPLLHFLISTKLECVYKNHYELFLLPHPQLELITIYPYKCHCTKSKHMQNNCSYLGSIPPPWTIEFDNRCVLFMKFLHDLICANFICIEWWHIFFNIDTHPYISLNDASDLTMFWYQKKGVWKVSRHHKSKFCTYDFYNLHSAI
jgi:hypothetical protein